MELYAYLCIIFKRDKKYMIYWDVVKRWSEELFMWWWI